MLPLYQRYQGNVKQRGTVCVSVCLHLNHVVPIVATMFKPFMKEQYYYAPLEYACTSVGGASGALEEQGG